MKIPAMNRPAVSHLISSASTNWIRFTGVISASTQW